MRRTTCKLSSNRIHAKSEILIVCMHQFCVPKYKEVLLYVVNERQNASENIYCLWFCVDKRHSLCWDSNGIVNPKILFFLHSS